MGNYKFRLSDMMPNAWFYKLRDMSRTRNHNTSHPVKKKIPSPSASQKSYLCQPDYHRTAETTRSAADKFFNSPTNPKLSDTHFPDPPRKSSNRNRNKIRKTIYKPSPRLVTRSVPEPAHGARDCLLSSSESSASSPDQSEFESNTIDGPDSFDGGIPAWSSSCGCRVTSSTTDIIIDVNGNSSFSRKVDHKLDGFDSIPGLELELPPILTKPVKFKEPANPKFEEDHESSFSKKDSTKTTTTSSTPFVRKSGSNSSTGVRIRGNSPRIACKKAQGGRRSVSSSKSSNKPQRMRSFSESFAIVKSSFDPQRDFKDSMVEMIVENNIRASKDLEELLACYLSLNSDEYHELIVKAFEQIWFDMADLRM